MVLPKHTRHARDKTDLSVVHRHTIKVEVKVTVPVVPQREFACSDTRRSGMCVSNLSTFPHPNIQITSRPFYMPAPLCMIGRVSPDIYSTDACIAWPETVELVRTAHARLGA